MWNKARSCTHVALSDVLFCNVYLYLSFARVRTWLFIYFEDLRSIAFIDCRYYSWNRNTLLWRTWCRLVSALFMITLHGPTLLSAPSEVGRSSCGGVASVCRTCPHCSSGARGNSLFLTLVFPDAQATPEPPVIADECTSLLDS